MAGEEIRSRYEQYSRLFGKEIRVTVNRPMRSVRHPVQLTPKTGNNVPQHSGLPPRPQRPYPVNGGYITARDLEEAGIPVSVSTDGEPVPQPDAPVHYVYILGVKEPLTSFTGKIAAIVHRESSAPSAAGLPLGRYDRLVVIPADRELYEPEIRASIAFAERRFRYRLYCMFEKSCGAVVYTLRDGCPLYLLIRNRSGHIGFPKGHVELGEDERATMKREIREETALRVEPDLRFREEYRYVLWNVVHKTAVYSLAYFTDGQKVTTMANEIFGDWLVPYAEARELLSYDNDRAILDRAHAYLTADGTKTPVIPGADRGETQT